ncbi:MAG TPA: hypothetical protein VFN49_09055, partial [Candidatus Aquilonibacter sp.]|nr:hypothetical protein [Candidatus Aquilonibacter sp.]
MSEPRGSLLNRAGFIGAVSAAALPLFAEPARALDAIEVSTSHGPSSLAVPPGIAAPNARAAAIAAGSPFVSALYAQTTDLARSIGDAALRADVVSLLHEPVASYQRKYPDAQSRITLRDALARQGFVAADAPVSGIFPPLPASGIAQPFWSAPGSDTNGHHSYPGGLCAHELFNSRMAAQFATTYDRQYFDSKNAVSRDLVVAAALYHDIMKTVVFQYRDDATFLDELSIGATGAHHCLSGAEAILRGRSPEFVTVLLSAHAAPSLGDEAKVVTWCRASAMIAGVDPVAYGLVKKSGAGYELAKRPPIETFVNHLSDHDYVLAIHAARSVRPMLDSIAGQFGIDSADRSALNWWKLRVCSRASEIALYHEL